MQTKMGFTTATRAETLARLLHGEREGAEGRALERAERLAHMVETDWRRAIVWLRQTLDYEGVTRPVLAGLGFDWLGIDAADTLVVRQAESVRAYAKRVAACNDGDVLAVAVAAIDDEIREGTEGQHDTRSAYKEARRVLQRAADALPNQQPGDPPPAGGVVDNLPTAPALRNALLSLVDHTDGAQHAMMEMQRGPGNVPWGGVERLSPDDLVLLVATLHDLLQVVGKLVIDVTTRGDENTYEDGMTLVEIETKGVSLMQAMATMGKTVARRLQDFIKWQSDGGPKDEKVH